MKHVLVGALVWIAAELVVLPSAAQSGTDTVLAETLYRQGRELVAAGKHAEACPKFAASQRLEPATGTLLNLASCYETIGKLASAWVAYSDAAVAARRDGREDRVQFARERIAALEPRLSRLTVVVAPDAEAADLDVRLNGAALGPAARNVPTPVDPGVHVIEARATGKKPWTLRVRIERESANQVVTVRALEDAPAAAASATSQGTPPASTPELDGPRSTRPLTTPVIVAGGVTIALTSAAVVTGVLYLNKRSDYDAANADPRASEAERRDLHDGARSMGIASTVLAGTALAGGLVTGYLFFSRPEQTTPSARHALPKRAVSSIVPFAGPSSAGLLITGAL